MSDPKVRGVVHLIEPTKNYGQNGFRKRLVVLEQNSARFTNYVPLEFTGDRCDQADQLREGEEVEVTYRLNGRKWQKDAHSEVKFFLNAEALSFTSIGGGSGQGSSGNDATINDQFAEAVDDDEVPF